MRIIAHDKSSRSVVNFRQIQYIVQKSVYANFYLKNRSCLRKKQFSFLDFFYWCSHISSTVYYFKCRKGIRVSILIPWKPLPNVLHRYSLLGKVQCLTDLEYDVSLSETLSCNKCPYSFWPSWLEGVFLDVIRTKIGRLLLHAIHSHLYQCPG
jgi:hypothetical protein